MGMGCKSRKSRNTCSNQQVWHWNAKRSRAKTNRGFLQQTGHSKHPLPTTQEIILHMDITRWSIMKSDWLYSLQLKMEKLYTVSKNKTRSWLWFNHELLVAKFRYKWKKLGKVTRPFRNDLNQSFMTIQWKWQIDPRIRSDRVLEEL